MSRSSDPQARCSTRRWIDPVSIAKEVYVAHVATHFKWEAFVEDLERVARQLRG